MLDKIIEQFFVLILVVTFFICSTAYNVVYFGTFGDSFLYFLYIPVSFFDLVKTGLVMTLPLFAFLIIFKPILFNPAFSGKFPGSALLLSISALVLVCNIFYFGIFVDSYNRLNSMLSELFFYAFLLVFGFGILYYFCREKSKQLVFSIFLLSLVSISAFLGFADARITEYSFSSEAKSQILLKSTRIVSAKILRSFDKGMFVISVNDSKINSVNFISWDEIKEVKFRKTSVL